MKFTVLLAMLVGFCGGLAGCGGGLSDGDRLKVLVPNAKTTIPVSGKVLVDGKPVKDLWVKMTLKNPTRADLVPSAQTDGYGDFKITTYVDGDGAPAGDYKITIEWLHHRPDDEWVGPSKLGGLCGNPKTTEYSVSVNDEPVVLPTFEVKARADADKLTPRKSAN